LVSVFPGLVFQIGFSKDRFLTGYWTAKSLYKIVCQKVYQDAGEFSVGARFVSVINEIKNNYDSVKNKEQNF
jgi:hypothetical protein